MSRRTNSLTGFNNAAAIIAICVVGSLMLLSVGLFVIAKVFVKLYPGFFLPKDESPAARDSSNEKTQESAKTLVSTLTFSSWRNGGAQEDPEKKIAPQEAQSEDSNSSNGSELSDSLKSSSQSRSFSDESAQVDQPQDCRVRREGSKFSDMIRVLPCPGNHLSHREY